jgi:hypothetical protein
VDAYRFLDLTSTNMKTSDVATTLVTICCTLLKFSVMSSGAGNFASSRRSNGTSRSARGCLTSRNKKKCSSKMLNAQQLFALLSVIYSINTRIPKYIKYRY